MSDQKAFYIVTVSGGKCLENTQTAQGVLDCLPKDNDKRQHWVLETGEEPNTVAFKSCADGQYLRNNEPNKINWGRIGVGEKQWWTLEGSPTPKSCLIRSNACTSGASYLNDFEGVYRDNNYVHMWQMVKAREYWLAWWIVDAESSASFNPVLESGQAAAAAADSGKLEAREKTVAEKEEELKKLENQRKKDIEQREAALKKNEQELTNQQATLKRREQELAKQQAAQNKGGSEPAAKPQQQKPSAPKPTPRECGHKVYPPPRKLEKRVVGYLYDGVRAH
ncbi:uncharacterized protein LTR77_008277 [Saxophila tyrrhenica]|uniref:Ricin B lectin domain-containing protein n=1 Tax=Saxophila tyrrhenica TaxID=1690608 RepID=A0AAV9P5B3_9PEZI|nr:hypothetical protein LTR77_008277 [Saxophila tyrrhenica]